MKTGTGALLAAIGLLIWLAAAASLLGPAKLQSIVGLFALC
ncbi:MAG TPA: hypothetical protein VM406_10765 [Noviherbaspirillum sp.]|nr:hypothetical protein [Noviherbaspirillum sp.]